MFVRMYASSTSTEHKDQSNPSPRAIPVCFIAVEPARRSSVRAGVECECMGRWVRRSCRCAHTRWPCWTRRRTGSCWATCCSSCRLSDTRRTTTRTCCASSSSAPPATRRWPWPHTRFRNLGASRRSETVHASRAYRIRILGRCHEC